jgi:hypothetical protein
VREAVAAARAVAALAMKDAPRSALLDEAERPHVEEVGGAKIVPMGCTSAETLVAVHDHIRREMAEFRRAAPGRFDAAAARSMLTRTTVRQHDGTLGAFCTQFWRFVMARHTVEDRTMLPALHWMDGGWRQCWSGCARRMRASRGRWGALTSL